MKYLVNKETKEHKVTTDIFRSPNQIPDWLLVEADSDGWIKHEGDKCPLPDDARCEVKFADGFTGRTLNAGYYGWSGLPNYTKISHYRPILAEPEKVQEPEPVVKDSLTTDILDRLKAAHEHAQQIPDLEAELREVLGSMGYDLVTRSPFFETEAHGTDAAVKDALIYGTSVMRGGKYTPIQDFYVAPEAAKENNDEL
jgi:hypothetical protein